jgi:predicted dehydrogenase
MTQNRLKVVQVGCGAMGRGWIDNALKIPQIELVGLVDVQRKAAEAAAEKFGLPGTVVFDTLAGAIEKTGADAVFDVTIPAAHESVVVEALGLGRHVLGEKPMSETLDSAQRMVAAAKKSGKTYAVTQNYRYQPAIRSLKSFLASDSIGPVQEAHAEFFIGAHFGGFRDEMAYPLILDMSIHTFDAARFLTGANPVSVYCHSFNPRRSWYKGDASAVAIFEMSDGIVFSYRGSWCSEGLKTNWDSSWRVLGSKGTVTWDGGEKFNAEATKADAKPAFHLVQQNLDVPINPLPHTGHSAVMHEFVSAIAENRKPETDCEDNIKSLAMVLAAVESAKSGKKVPVVW